MIDEANERQPLLGERGADETASIHTTSNKLQQAISSTWHERLPVYKILLTTFFIYACSQGTASATFEMTRALACAEYYEKHPSTSSDSERLCDNDWIEAQSAFVQSIVNVVGSLLATAAIVVIEPRLHRWGRKRIVLVGIMLFALDRLTNLMVPIGYPYGPRAEEMSISPTWVTRWWLLGSTVSYAFGAETVPLICLRLMVTEASDADSKTSGLVGLTQMSMISIAIVPALTSWLGSMLPITSASMLRLVMRSFGHHSDDVFAHLGHHHSPVILPPGGGGGDQVPSPTLPQPGSYNVGAFVVSMITVAITFLVANALLPADKPRAEAGTDVDSDVASTDDQSATRTSTAPRESIFWRVWPRKDIDGKRDWRILTIVTVALMHFMSAYSINIYIMFFGHAFHWGQEAVGVMLSALGITRMATLFCVVPLYNAYFERTVKRPSALSGMTLEAIKAAAKATPADEAPLESTWEVAQGDTDEEDEDDGTAQRHAVGHAIATWRARVDRGVLALSYGADLFGWLLIALFTMMNSVSMILLGGLVVSLGAAAMPARMGVDLVIVSDVLARTAETPGSVADVDGRSSPVVPDVQAGELYFALMGFFESFALVLSPIVATSVYDRTLSSFPAANWLLTCAFYSSVLLLHFSMPVHRRRQRATAS